MTYSSHPSTAVRRRQAAGGPSPGSRDDYPDTTLPMADAVDQAHLGDPKEHLMGWPIRSLREREAQAIKNGRELKLGLDQAFILRHVAYLAGGTEGLAFESFAEMKKDLGDIGKHRLRDGLNALVDQGLLGRTRRSHKSTIYWLTSQFWPGIDMGSIPDGGESRVGIDMGSIPDGGESRVGIDGGSIPGRGESRVGIDMGSIPDGGESRVGIDMGSIPEQVEHITVGIDMGSIPDGWESRVGFDLGVNLPTGRESRVGIGMRTIH